MQAQKSQTKSMGGYFQLHLANGEEYYPDLIKLNTSRNALQYILEVKKYTKVYIPYFTCEVLLEPMVKLNIPYQFYHIDEQLEPIFDFEVGPTECVVYNNYFGLKQDAVKKLSDTVPHLIIDNAQAFFSEPVPKIDTFYSCRKFFGVPDGAYLQINSDERLSPENDTSIHRFSHLITSIDHSVEHGYADFMENELGFIGNEIKSMSSLTQAVLANVDYQACKNKRIENFNFLHEKLSSINELGMELPTSTPAMLYPLLISKADVKAKLIEKKIFVPTYWPNVFRWTTQDTLEYKLAKNVIYLPMDHRYDLKNMAYMLDVLTKII
jgi:hypothetical protein